MSEINSWCASVLKKVQWQDADTFTCSNEWQQYWLLGLDSLSRRLEQHCQVLSVSVLDNTHVDSSALRADEIALIGDGVCLRRKVVLRGDAVDWIYGRTLIPLSSLQDQPHDLTKQGHVPLGITVFSAQDVFRDQLQVAKILTEKGELFARRSRLWMNGKPMLVAELFLPKASIYSDNYYLEKNNSKGSEE
ncbi:MULTISPECIES: chorismate--pyruvate lyase family protein [Aliivibrio]|uniref:Probable chorismate pyruvate-lyase n=2 Tax=Aliivibrio logei TaxID=688 RepID=A0A1B9NVB1_ALILO|nr:MULTISPECIES: chorismate lyase [Aliivibrio]MBB1313363.1 chorismate lyase [Aliivibrio sp. SR45-2]OCH18439.1 chorismate--pyruvate lyase [Aliivibrio logei]OEF09708.1 chorismate--pyruvate lyase [Aliivibrio logei 5S-186]